MSDTISTQRRGGFWRRAIAFFIDGFLVGVLVGLIGLVLFAQTGGRIRVSGMGFNSQDCFPQELQTLEGLGLTLPADFHPTHVVRCTGSFLGFIHDRRLIVAEVTRSEPMTYTRGAEFPVDAEGRPTHAFYIDFLSFFLLVGYVVVLQRRFGRTLGMDLMNIRLRSLTGAPPTVAQVAIRLLFLSIPGLIASTMLLGPLFGATAPTLYWSIAVVALVAGAMIAINFIDMVRRHALPWHDRLAGTEVVVGR